MIDSSVKPNVLNRFYQSTYHFRFFLAGDMDLMSQTGQKNGTVQGSSNFENFYSSIDSVPQITIAESGVTGYSIKEVSLVTLPAGNMTTRGSKAQTFSMTITEPLGISFLDALVDSARILKIKNYTKAPFYLELYFLGYDASGQSVSSESIQGDTPGRWIWAVTITNIDVKLNEGGGVYTLVLQTVTTKLLTEDYDLIRAPQPFFAIGDTVQELFDDYITKLNAAWVSRYGGGLVHFEPIETWTVFFEHPPPAAGKDPGKFKMKPAKQEENPNRNWRFDEKTGKYTVNVTPGYPIQDFILDAIKHTPEAQELALDNNNLTMQVDQSANQVNDRNMRESITFTVEPTITVKQFDTVSGNYVQNIKFHVIPHYSSPILSRTQIKNAMDATVQYNMVKSLVENGSLRKRYDYIFTGKNTEVIDFDLHFSMFYNNLIASYDGALMRYDAYHVNQRLSVENKAPDANRPEASLKFDPQPTQAGQSVPSTPNATVANNVAIPNFAGAARVATANTGGSEVVRPANNSFAEDFLNSNDNIDFTVPLSTWQGVKDVDNNSGNDIFPGQMHIAQSVYGSIVSQLYTARAPGEYNSIKLTIRGDPYWLGQSNLERQIQLTNKGQIAPSKNPLPDYQTSAHLFLYFRYPTQVGDDYKPNMKTSAVFNGLYKITVVENFFSDGIFKQVLTCVKESLIDTAKWLQNSSNPDAVSQVQSGIV